MRAARSTSMRGWNRRPAAVLTAVGTDSRSQRSRGDRANRGVRSRGQEHADRHRALPARDDAADEADGPDAAPTCTSGERSRRPTERPGRNDQRRLQWSATGVTYTNAIARLMFEGDGCWSIASSSAMTARSARRHRRAGHRAPKHRRDERAGIGVEVQGARQRVRQRGDRKRSARDRRRGQADHHR